MLIAERFSETNSFTGSWIEPSGAVRYCDHANDIHHSSIALEQFGDYIDLDGYDEYSETDKEEAMSVALQEGWLQIVYLTWGGTLPKIGIYWHGRATRAQQNEVHYQISELNLGGAVSFSIKHGGRFEAFDNASDFLLYLDKELRRS